MKHHPEPYWSAAMVKTSDEMGVDEDTGEETGVAARLRNLGIEVYCPCYLRTVRSRWKRRPREIVTAAFPGYLLIDYSTAIRHIEDVRKTPGFQHFLCNGDTGRVRRIPTRVIEQIRAWESDGTLLPRRLDVLIGRVVKGAKVRVEGGPAGGMRGIVEAVINGRATLGGGDFKYPMRLPVENLDMEGI